MSQTRHGWLTLMVNAMTTHPMESTDQVLLLIARQKESDANGPSLPPEELTYVSGTPTHSKRVSKPTKTRFTVSLPGTLLDRLRNAVYWTQGLTLAALIEQAITEFLERMEKQHGEPFPPRIEELKGGRPRRVRSDLDRS